MEPKDYYQILGIDKNASQDTIRKAFKSLASKFHPDKNPNDPNATSHFKEINEAYSTLSNPDKKQQYDTLGHIPPHHNQDPFSNINDIFSSFFNQQPRRGQDIQIIQEISLKESLTGCKKDINISIPHTCPSCNGSRCQPNTSPSPCIHCKGSGQTLFQQGPFTMSHPCNHCNGQGSSIPHPCSPCNGTGQIPKNKSFSLTFPPGIDSGQKLKINNAGLPSPHGPGHLYVITQIAQEPNWQRRGTELLHLLHIPLTTAILGNNNFSTQHIDNSTLTLNIPKGSQHGDTITIHKRGAKSTNSPETGDLQIILNISIPSSLSPKALDLISQLHQELNSP
jgi:molecular chaperone DnaJ